MENKKIIIKIDLLKIDKNRIEEKSYTNQSGFEVKQKIYSIELVPTMGKVIKEFENSNLVKRYFVAESQNQHERENKIKTTIIGDGLVFEDKVKVEKEKEPNMYGGEAEIDSDQIPF